MEFLQREFLELPTRAYLSFCAVAKRPLKSTLAKGFKRRSATPP
jgi:hypothetical protein